MRWPKSIWPSAWHDLTADEAFSFTGRHHADGSHLSNGQRGIVRTIRLGDVVKIDGERHYLWRAADHVGEILESFVTKTRDKKVALKFLKKAMRKHGQPEIVVTDKLRSYGAALEELGAGDRQETGRWLNNRAENSHLSFRRRARAILRFRRMRSLQKFAAVHASVLNHFNQERSFSSRHHFKINRAAALSEWRALCTA